MSDTLASTFESLTGISLYTILRLTMLIGGYILLRPLIELSFRRLFATQQHSEKTVSTQPPRREKTLADEHITGPYDFLDLNASEDPTSDSDDDGRATGVSANWGDTARRKEAKFMEYWEAEQARLAEEDDLADIADLLEDD